MLIFTLAARELKTLFCSPLAWTILGVLQALLAYIFLTQLDTYLGLQSRLAIIDKAPGLTQLVIVPLYTSFGMILLLITPLLTMRLIAEERRNKTLALLLSAPISNTEIILGKFLSVFAFLLIAVVLISVMPFSLIAGSQPDVGKILANILGLSLLTGSFAAIGLYMSCIASHPTVAAVGTFGSLLLLWILDWSADLSHQSNQVLEYFSLLNHYQRLQTGLIDTGDICYYLLFCATFLMLSIRRLNNDRLQQ